MPTQMKQKVDDIYQYSVKTKQHFNITKIYSSERNL